ncbi:MAG TPA: 1,2-phenylacetyl-CoA epoxidase subunit PaaE [Stackebrandtia sp.]|jgi:ring-1,2-phenylacetyl-CoA epoxidase subunit PaaE|uniref:1,2-phenylacetyl-CoA epoxidase subunit PaaE n=1 Tax=Stackebrandtia sp. TaxID=2023065 RepID=UPI002D49FE41|nr:1,2-phenylacetyl-CoA epoxidase subunit PaaE [Stackebrandtia sp.]HZE39904.1 1,2-phenylacetyl-CoA epoxidase subunit PaaE [Stackebrandtia sp.]
MAVTLSRPQRHRPQWHKLPVSGVERLTDEAVCVAFAVPPSLRGAFDFSPGQHLTLRRFEDDEEVRRSYSICSTPSTLKSDGLLRVGIKQVPTGSFSGYANTGLAPGDVVEVLPPLGNFTTALDPKRSRHYAGIIAGSGITPVLSIAASALEVEPESRVTLVFGNKRASTVMFADALADLKDRFAERLQLIHVLSREPQAAELMHGRLDPARLARLFDTLVPADTVDDWFLCGPYGMVTGAQKALADAGVDASAVHTELFFADEIPPPPPEEGESGEAEATIVLDGRSTTVTMRRDERVLDAALRARPELPYACKGGVCATCRAKLLHGEVHMARNFALDDADLDAGYVLTCQSTPKTERITVDYDA